MKKVSEVRNTHIDEDEGLVYIDVYTSNDDDEEGFVVAVVCVDTHKVIWFKNDYRNHPLVLESINEAKQELKKDYNFLEKYQKLESAINHEMGLKCAMGDYGTHVFTTHDINEITEDGSYKNLLPKVEYRNVISKISFDIYVYSVKGDKHVLYIDGDGAVSYCNWDCFSLEDKAKLVSCK